MLELKFSNIFMHALVIYNFNEDPLKQKFPPSGTKSSMGFFDNQGQMTPMQKVEFCGVSNFSDFKPVLGLYKLQKAG